METVGDAAEQSREVAEYVRSQVDWRRVETRLTRYSAIAAHFPLDKLRLDTPGPYFCHGLAWRLGTWGPGSDVAFRLFDDLLVEGSKLPGWSGRASGIGDPDYSSFWSLLWELQVAAFLASRGLQPRWPASGPDLIVQLAARRGFVECYVYQKSFGVGSFLDELLRRIHPNLRLDHRLFSQYSIPSGRDRVAYLTSLIAPLLHTPTIHRLEEKARRRYPVLVDMPSGGTGGFVYMDGFDGAEYNPAIGAPLGTTGEPTE